MAQTNAMVELIKKVSKTAGVNETAAKLAIDAVLAEIAAPKLLGRPIPIDRTVADNNACNNCLR